MFITFEGPDGGGKTSQFKALAQELAQRGYPLLATREPGGTSIGDQVREVLLNLKNKEMHPRAEILLYQASRAQLVEQVIRPHLQQGGIVLCDRYADSTLAYQGYGHQVDLQQLRQVVNFATGGLKPDLTVLFDLDVETGLQRRASGGGWNRLDAYDLAFHQRVRQGYHELACQEPQRWVTIDAGQSYAAVQSAVRDLIYPRLALWGFDTAR
jgi:dTMP kinase